MENKETNKITSNLDVMIDINNDINNNTISNDPYVLIITGPSGSGKDTFVNDLRKIDPAYIPAFYNTSRFPRSTIDTNTLMQKLITIRDMKNNFNFMNELQKTIPVIFNSYYFHPTKFYNEFIDVQKELKKWELLNNLYPENSNSYLFLLEFCYNNDLLRSFIHLNTENEYINWIHKNDEERIKKDKDDLCATVINNFYYAQCISDVQQKLKSQKNVIVNATPDTWDEINEKLNKLNIKHSFLWIKADEEIRKDRMMVRDKEEDKVLKRLKFDKTIWNKEREEYVLNKFDCKFLDGNKNPNDTLNEFLTKKDDMIKSKLKR